MTATFPRHHTSSFMSEQAPVGRQPPHVADSVAKSCCEHARHGVATAVPCEPHGAIRCSPSSELVADPEREEEVELALEFVRWANQLYRPQARER
jgi:hypothetical protein